MPAKTKSMLKRLGLIKKNTPLKKGMLVKQLFPNCPIKMIWRIAGKKNHRWIICVDMSGRYFAKIMSRTREDYFRETSELL